MGITNFLKLVLCTLLIRETEAVKCAGLGNAEFTNASPFNKLPAPQCFVPSFELFTRTVSEGVDISLTNVPNEFCSDKRTIITIHGWNDSPAQGSQWMKRLTTELLTQGDFNVIETDWSSHGSTGILAYKQAAANTRVAGIAIALLFANLVTNYGLSQSNTHCIGHSLGAHICGYAGKNLIFGRISGLDPAGPEFKNLDPEYRLWKDDANFVDVIHTDGGNNNILDYGLLVNIGHADFYPNGGKKQPGCSLNKREIKDLGVELGLSKDQITTLKEVERSLDIACSHKRAFEYYIESVNSRNCKATETCTDYNKIQKVWGWFFNKSSSCKSCKSCQEMGYHSISYPNNKGIFSLETNSGVPYCQG